MEGHGPSWPWGGSGIPWRAMLRHGRLFPGHRARQTVRPKDGRDRARPSKEDRHGGPCSVMAAGGIRYPMEGHAPSWPPLPRTPCQANRKAQRRTRQSASLQGRSPWRAMVPHGRGGDPVYPMEGHAPSWPQGDDAVAGRFQRTSCGPVLPAFPCHHFCSQ